MKSSRSRKEREKTEPIRRQFNWMNFYNSPFCGFNNVKSLIYCKLKLSNWQYFNSILVSFFLCLCLRLWDPKFNQKKKKHIQTKSLISQNNYNENVLSLRWSRIVISQSACISLLSLIITRNTLAQTLGINK